MKNMHKKALLAFIIILLIAIAGWVWFKEKDSNTEIHNNPEMTTNQKGQNLEWELLEAQQDMRSKSDLDKPNLLEAHDKYEIVLPSGWNKLQPKNDSSLWVSIALQSPDYVRKSGVYGGVEKGAEIIVTTSVLNESHASVEDILNGTPEAVLVGGLPVGEAVSRQRSVTVSSRQAVEYLWKWEGPHRLITTVDEDGVRYSIYYNDVSTFDQHSNEYYAIINSFRFK